MREIISKIFGGNCKKETAFRRKLFRSIVWPELSFDTGIVTLTADVKKTVFLGLYKKATTFVRRINVVAFLYSHANFDRKYTGVLN